MASAKIKIGLAAALIAAESIPIAVQHHSNTRLRAEVEQFRQQGAELARLRDDLQRLSFEAQSLATQRGKDSAELGRLRGELAAAKTRESKSSLAAKSRTAAAPRAPTDASGTDKEELVQRDA